MAIFVGSKRLGPDPDQLLNQLADLWIEAAEAGRELRQLEQKVAQQDDWLDRNRADERYPARVMHAFVTRKAFEHQQVIVREIGMKAGQLVDRMDDETKERAAADIHAWAMLGVVGVEAVAWGITPDPAWFGRAKAS